MYASVCYCCWCCIWMMLVVYVNDVLVKEIFFILLEYLAKWTTLKLLKHDKFIHFVSILTIIEAFFTGVTYIIFSYSLFVLILHIYSNHSIISYSVLTCTNLAVTKLTLHGHFLCFYKEFPFNNLLKKPHC